MNDDMYDRLPEHMRDGARLYVEHHIEPGGFLRAVLENDLVLAAGKADSVNAAALRDWAVWLYCDCPSELWGSKTKVNAWLAKWEPSE